MYRIRAFSGLLGAGILATQISSSPHAHMDAQATARKPKETVATSAIVQTVSAAAPLPFPPKETHVNVAKPFYTFDAATQEITLDPTQYKRIDKELMQLPRYKAFASGNALHDTLTGGHLVEKYHIYRKLGSDEIVAVVRFGDKMNGHPNFVHGGITSLVFDNTFGWLFFGLDLPLAVTANLNVNYRAPLPMNTTCILQSKLIRHEGRKMFMEATMHDLHGQKIADSTSLFISLKPAAAMAATVQMKAREYFLPEKEDA